MIYFGLLKIAHSCRALVGLISKSPDAHLEIKDLIFIARQNITNLKNYLKGV